MSKQSIVLGGGCFWCLDAIYRITEGVESVISGYAGGDTKNPTYNEVSEGNTGHAEVVKVKFDEKKVSLFKILEIFWHGHDPTTLNRQGFDVGTQYRSAIYFSEESQLKIINQSIEQVAKDLWGEQITTEIEPLDQFYPAEEYHQDYYNKNPNAGYCRAIISPKISKISKFLE